MEKNFNVLKKIKIYYYYFYFKGSSRVDKIKIVDIAAVYIEHLHQIIKSYQEKDEIYRLTSSVEKVNVSTNTVENIDSLWYIKGVFNGTIEFVTYLIDSMGKSLSPWLDQTERSYSKNFEPFNIESFITILRRFHNIYFRENKLNESDTSFVTKPLNGKRFALNDPNVMKNVLFALSSDYQLPAKFYRKMLNKSRSKSYKDVISNENSSSSAMTSSESDDELQSTKFTIPAEILEFSTPLTRKTKLNNQIPEIESNTYNMISNTIIPSNKNLRENYNHRSQNLYSKQYISIENEKNNNIQFNSIRQLPNKTTQEVNIESINIKKAKKLKSNLIERFNDTGNNQSLVNIQHSQSDINLLNKTKTQNDTINSNTVSDDIYCLSKAIPQNSNIESSIEIIREENVNNNLLNKASNELVTNNLIPNNVFDGNLTEKIPFLQSDTSVNDSSSTSKYTLFPTNFLSIFILHSSQDFYISASIDSSLLEKNFLNNIIKNEKYKPVSLHKIKLDVAFLPNMTIINKNSTDSNDNNHNGGNENDKNNVQKQKNAEESMKPNYASQSTFMDLNYRQSGIQTNYLNSNLTNHKENLINNYPIFFNKNDISKKLHSRHKKFYNHLRYNFYKKDCDTENKILESYLNQIRNSYQNDTVIYKNYSQSLTSEQSYDDTTSESTFKSY